MAGRVTVDGAVVTKAGAPTAGRGRAAGGRARPVRLAGRREARERARGVRDRRRRRAVPGRGRLDRRVHGLPAGPRRRPGGRGRRRPQPAARADRGRSAGHGDGRLQRPQPDRRGSAVSADVRHRRRVVHLAAAGAAGRVRRGSRAAWRGVVLVKPQFEAGREQVRKGVVRDPEVHRQVLRDICGFVTRSRRRPSLECAILVCGARRGTASI